MSLSKITWCFFFSFSSNLRRNSSCLIRAICCRLLSRSISIAYISSFCLANSCAFRAASSAFCRASSSSRFFLASSACWFFSSRSLRCCSSRSLRSASFAWRAFSLFLFISSLACFLASRISCCCLAISILCSTPSAACRVNTFSSSNRRLTSTSVILMYSPSVAYGGGAGCRNVPTIAFAEKLKLSRPRSRGLNWSKYN
uniref:Uncharacterized protein n=1 Tax=Anopheles darlingi TaxID=43151 RepID=A0A2M4CXB6_ANODA